MVVVKQPDFPFTITNKNSTDYVRKLLKWNYNNPKSFTQKFYLIILNGILARLIDGQGIPGSYQFDACSLNWNPCFLVPILHLLVLIL